MDAIAAFNSGVVFSNSDSRCPKRAVGVSNVIAGSEKRVVPNMSWPPPDAGLPPEPPPFPSMSRLPRPTSRREMPLPSHREKRSSLKDPAPFAPGGGFGDRA